MLDAKIRTLTIITLAMMTSGFLYTGVLFFIATEPQEVEVTVNLVMIAAAFAVMGAVLPVRRVLMGGFALLPESKPSTTDPLPPDETRKALLAATARYTTGTIVSMAMSESVILFGFVMAFLAQEPFRIVPFLLAGELLMVAMFPRRSILETLLSPAARAGLSAKGFEDAPLGFR